MKTRMSIIATTLVLWNGLAYADDAPPQWQPVAAGVVLTRNFMVPASPKEDGYHLMPEKYRMGDKAYGRSTPEWWVKLARESKLNSKWHKDELPLAYAGEFSSKDGKRVLLVVEVNHAFTGDGFLFGPGGEIYLIARKFAIENQKDTPLSEDRFESCNLSDMQYSRLFAGEAKERRIEFRQERGAQFDSRTVSSKRTSVLVVGDDNSLKFEKGEWVEAKEKKDAAAPKHGAVVEFDKVIEENNQKYAQFRFVNRGTTPVTFRGYSGNSPRTKLQHKTDAGWETVGWDWCGTGSANHPLPPGKEMLIKTRFMADQRVRLGILSTDASDKNDDAIWSNEVKLPSK